MKTIFKNHPNFRDLGGLTTKSGKRVKHQVAFRSSHLGSLDEDDLMKLKELNIGKIIDLRTSHEIELTGSAAFSGSIEYQNISIDAGNISAHLIPIFQKGEFHRLEVNLLDKIYLDLITKFNQEMTLIFRALLQSYKAVVYHCSHGKDRTGVISALLLDYLEVDRKDIIADYLLSNELLKSSNDAQMQKIKDNFTEMFSRQVSHEEFEPVAQLFQCHERLLNIVFNYIDSKYGNVKQYFSQELGLKTEELELLKSNYLE